MAGPHAPSRKVGPTQLLTTPAKQEPEGYLGSRQAGLPASVLPVKLTRLLLLMIFHVVADYLFSLGFSNSGRAGVISVRLSFV